MSPQRVGAAEAVLAAALAQGGELGFFAPADVRAPLSAIMPKPRSGPRIKWLLNRASRAADPKAQVCA